MEIYVNYHYMSYCQRWSFDNGWTCVVMAKDTGTYDVSVLPTEDAEIILSGSNSKAFRDKWSSDHYKKKAMIARGDAFSDIGGDNNLLAIIVAVSERPIEKKLSAVNDMIMRAAKNSG